MAWQWWLFLHIAGVLAFLGAHGVSLFVLYRIRHEGDRQKIAELIAFSGTTTRPMYHSLLVLTVGGIGTGITLHLFSAWWLWTAIVILLVTIALMTAVAKPYFRKITASCEVRPSGVPRVSDEELAQLLGSGEAHVITAIGGIGLLAILYLMVLRPF
ncbi:MAG: hypothetical protein ACXVEI_05380 [Actinomycetota bacterium]